MTELEAHGGRVQGGWYMGFIAGWADGEFGYVWQCDHRHGSTREGRACAEKALDDDAYREQHDLDIQVQGENPRWPVHA